MRNGFGDFLTSLWHRSSRFDRGNTALACKVQFHLPAEIRARRPDRAQCRLMGPQGGINS